MAIGAKNNAKHDYFVEFLENHYQSLDGRSIEFPSVGLRRDRRFLDAESH